MPDMPRNTLHPIARTSTMLVHVSLALGVALVVASPGAISAQASQRSSRAAAPAFSVVEASIADMRAALEQKRTTSHEIVLQYLTRIAIYEDRLNAEPAA